MSQRPIRLKFSLVAERDTKALHITEPQELLRTLLLIEV